MARKLEEIREMVQELSREDRRQLFVELRTLMDAGDGYFFAPDNEPTGEDQAAVDRAWAQEIERRVVSVKMGTAKTISIEEHEARVTAQFARYGLKRAV
jgi:hypothetical protein